jgi:uncharacterized protein (TIGR03435 family)
MRQLMALGIAVGIAVPTLRGQTPGDGAGVVFTELSIKASQTLETSFSASDVARRYVVHSGTALGLIRWAYPAVTTEVVGAPPWAATERFDIRASWSAPFAGSMEAMLRTLLAQRFGFAGHYESIEAPAFALTVASRDGSLGPRIRARDVVCPSAPGGSRPDPRGDTPPVCGWHGKRSADGAGIHMTANGVTMEQLARMFSVDNRPLVNRTGLTGRFQFELDYRRPYELETAPDGTVALVPLTDPAPGHTELPLALFEQLGLGLEPVTMPSQVFVVDRMQRPITD